MTTNCTYPEPTPSWAFAAGVDGAQVLNRFEQWPARRRRAEIEAGEERGRVSDFAMIFPELREIGIIAGLGERPDALDRGDERVAVDQIEHGFAHLAVGRFLIENNDPCIAELERGGVEIAQRAQSGLLRRCVGLCEHRSGDSVEQVDDVVSSRRLQRPDEGKEGGRAPVVRKPRDRLRLCRRCEARERHHFTWRQTIRLRKTVGDRADLFQAGERTADLAATLNVWTVAQAIERALAPAIGDRDELVEALPLLRRHRLDQQAVQMRACARPNPGHGALKHRQARQQHLGFKQPCSCAVEQRRGAVGAGPAQRI